MKPRALDLCCGGGGASVGLARAGYDVAGVDLAAWRGYPFPFTQRDILTLEPSDLAGFDLVWASPPCQRFTAYRRRDRERVGADSPDLIPFVRKLLAESGVPCTIIENVEGAPLEADSVRLCGSMFALDVQRHRRFECRGFTPPALDCRHEIWTPRFAPASNRANLRRTVEVGVGRIPMAVQRAAMGIDWLARDALTLAIPPAYAEHLGRAALARL